MCEQVEFTKWIFDCPEHGMEDGCFCFRAFDDKHIDNWQKVLIKRDPIYTSLEEKREYVKGLLEFH